MWIIENPLLNHSLQTFWFPDGTTSPACLCLHLERTRNTQTLSEKVIAEGENPELSPEVPDKEIRVTF